MSFATFSRTILISALWISVISANATKPSEKSGKASFADRVLALTNEQRAKVGEAPLALDDRLIESAHWKAEDMATRDYFDHADGRGRDFVDRAEEYGYADWTYLGENIAAGQTTPEEVVNEWMASPGHRRNILKPQFKEIGIAYATENHSTFRHYWVQEFGTR